MLTGGFHARTVHAIDKTPCDGERFYRILVIGAFANRGADMSHIKHGRETDVDIHRDHLACHQPARLFCYSAALFHTQQGRKRLGCRQVGKTFTKALNPTTFLIDSDHKAMA